MHRIGYMAIAIATVWSTAAFAAGVSVIPEAAYTGDRGMRILVNNLDPGYVVDDSPIALQEYRARFWINLNNLTLENGEEFDVFQALNSIDEVQFAVRIRRADPSNRLNVEVFDDSAALSEFTTNNEPLIAGGWNSIEIHWVAASGIGQDDGTFEVTFNGVAHPAITGLDTDQRQIDRVRLGLIDPSGTDTLATNGSFDIDEFISRESDMIGSTPTTNGIANLQVMGGTSESVIDLFAAFDDAEDADAALTFTLVEATNPTIYDTTLINNGAGTLTITYPEAIVLGTMSVTVRATDTDGLFIEDTFTATVFVDPPTKASAPDPADGATKVLVNDLVLSWTAGTGAESHDVYFGTVNPPPSIGNQAGSTYEPSSLDAETTYFWRVDEVNIGGTTEGDVWSFTTRVFGDVDGDNIVNAVDIQLVINAVLGISADPAADLNGDNVINSVDIQLIINRVLGI